MATITSTAAGGLASLGATWVGGVVPVQASAGIAGDKVVIATTGGNAVTLDGVYWWGDDTATAITINANAKLSASRTVNSGLTCCGQLVFVSQLSFLDAGTAASPIPSGVTFDLKLNHSVTLVNGKWGMTLAPGKLSLHGLTRTRNTVLSAALAIGATSCGVADATGWAVGDTIVLAPTTSYLSEDLRTITSITPGVGTAATIGFAALTYAHTSGAPVGNFSSNVSVAPYNALYFPTTTLYSTTASLAGDYHAENVAFIGREMSYGMWSFAANNNSSAVAAYDPLVNCAFLQTDSVFRGGGPVLGFGTANQEMSVSGIAVYNKAQEIPGVGYASRSSGRTQVALSNFVVYRNTSGYAFSTGNNTSTFNSITGSDLKLFGCDATPFLLSTIKGVAIDRAVFGPTQATVFVGLSNFGSLGTSSFTNSDFGATFGAGSAVAVFNPNNAYNATVALTLNNCTFAVAVTPALNLLNGACSVAVANKNGDPTQQAIYDNVGVRSLNSDSYSTDVPATGSYQFAPNGGTVAVTDSVDVFAQGGQIGGVNGYYKLSSPAPTSVVLTISGAGLAVPVTQTLTLTPTATWLPFLITCVPVVASNGYTLLSCKIDVIGPSGSYVRFDELQQVFAQFNPGAIAFFRDARPVLGARTLAPDVRYQPLQGLSFPVNSVGEALQKLNGTLSANVVQVRGQSLVGAGVAANPWGPA
jgi:hypothetical protein